jgi:hypothetical protein
MAHLTRPERHAQPLGSGGSRGSVGVVFDDLIELIGETKQVIWSASSPERRRFAMLALCTVGP